MKEYRFKIGGKPYLVAVGSIRDGKADVSVNGVSYSVELEDEAPSSPVEAAPVPGAAERKAAPQESSSAGRKVTSPLPGTILSVCVREGQRVSRGEKLAVIEAMKMENEILAPCAGTVSAICVDKGDAVPEGAPILTIA